MDAFLLNKVFMPIAHYVDWRFHQNNYTLAKWVLMTAIIMNVIQSPLYMTHDVLIGLLVLPACLMVAFLQISQIAILQKASDAYERSPGKQQALPVMGNIPIIRLVFLVIPVPFAVQRIILGASLFELTIIISNLWLTVEGVSLYFAAIPPPTARRREQASLTEMVTAPI